MWLEKGGYLDEDGVPKPEMDGVITYYCEVAGETVFLPSIKAFEEAYPNLKVGEDIEPLKFVFYAANVHDNPYICKYQKSYVMKLKNLPKIERRRLYEGSWYAKEEASGYFKQEWCNLVSEGEVPFDMRQARCWDRASTLPSTSNPDPDWTVGIKGGLDSMGNLWVTDMKRFRGRSATVQNTIEQTGLSDGSHIPVGIPQDVGAAGIDAMQASRASLMRCGLNVIINKARKGKAIRFEPVAVMAENRQIYVVKGDWNKDFFEELERLDFKTGHDDIADALSDLVSVLRNRMMTVNIKVNPNRRINRNTRL